MAHGAVHLAWTRVAGATEYEIWRSAPAVSNKRIGRTSATHFDDRHAKPRVAYTYAVRALNPRAAVARAREIRGA